jgi:16S rRNA (uracil1498-N3)-methyltransferase
LPGAVRADAGGAPPTLERATVLVGPEGGWSPGEVAVPLPTVGLGPHVLRAETAAITAGAIFAALRSGLVATV